MKKLKQHGFTVVELIIVIVVIALLATIATAAYRSTQAGARDEKRKADALMLRGAIEEYYSMHGTYPRPVCGGSGTSNECHDNEAWQLLVNEGLLNKVPVPPAGASRSTYGWLWASDTSYGVLVALENGTPPNHWCKFGKNMTATWWGSAPECDF